MLASTNAMLRSFTLLTTSVVLQVSFLLLDRRASTDFDLVSLLDSRVSTDFDLFVLNILNFFLGGGGPF